MGEQLQIAGLEITPRSARRTRQAAGGDAGVAERAGEFTTPGLIDIQVNGFAGVDFNSPGLSEKKIDHALGHLAASGVTCMLPTLITAHESRLVRQLRELDEAVSKSTLGPLMVAGYHIEGPFLSPSEGSSGAHPADAMIPASKRLVEKLMEAASRPLCIMTVAPEQQGVLELIPFLVENNISCAIGHTAASREQISAAIAAGATLSTHLGNGLPHTLNKHDNPLFTQLGRDELSAGFIADGVHIHPETLQTYLRAKTLAHTIIVTDAVSAAGEDMEPGIYHLAEAEVERHADGSVRIPGSTYLAGSSATMDQMVRNLMGWYGFSMNEILLVARQNPGAFIGEFLNDADTGAGGSVVRWHRVEGELRVVETCIGPWTVQRDYS
ncbi:MAG TPA: N-acetylglucosamine-6-phosphate deacetylase [Devosia sp.]|nr:N-acetylglucosamine-6-phosphate deacetylase [Devosia sp.]